MKCWLCLPRNRKWQMKRKKFVKKMKKRQTLLDKKLN